MSPKSIFPEETKHPILNDENKTENINKYAASVNAKKLRPSAQNIIDFKNDEVALAATNAAAITAAVDIVKKSNKELIQWQATPSTDLSKLINQYLMLSKIRLTSKNTY